MTFLTQQANKTKMRVVKHRFRGQLPLGEFLSAFAGFFALTVVFTWPLFPNMSTHAAQLGDYLLNTYIQAWVAHALATHPTQILNMNMLYPSRHVLAGSENLLGNQIFFAPVYGLTDNPMLAANVVTFVGWRS